MNPYDKLRDRFQLFSDYILYNIMKEDLAKNGYIGDEGFKSTTLDILNQYERKGYWSKKQKLLIINYLIH